MDICRMEFSGKLLKRGFWLYIWDIKGKRLIIFMWAELEIHLLQMLRRPFDV